MAVFATTQPTKLRLSGVLSRQVDSEIVGTNSHGRDDKSVVLCLLHVSAEHLLWCRSTPCWLPSDHVDLIFLRLQTVAAEWPKASVVLWLYQVSTQARIQDFGQGGQQSFDPRGP